MKIYENHELTKDVRMHTKLEAEALEYSIQNSGFNQNSPIVIFENKILDGRNRYMVCKKLNIDPTFVEFVGSYEAAKKEVLERNYISRHLTVSQKALKAVVLIEESGLKEGSATRHNLSIADAATIVGVNKRTVEKARELVKLDPDAIHLIQNDSTQTINKLLTIAKDKFMDSMGFKTTDDYQFIEDRILLSLNEFETDNYHKHMAFGKTHSILEVAMARVDSDNKYNKLKIKYDELKIKCEALQKQADILRQSLSAQNN